MRHLRHILLYFILLLTTHSGIAKIMLSGIVIDSESENPVSDASVSILLNNEKYRDITTNHLGRFSSELEQEGDYTLLISSPLYDSYMVEVDNLSTDTDLGLCPLTKSSSLSELIVEAERERIIKGKTLITPSNFQTSISSTAIDLLQTLSIPGLIYSELNNKISVDGKTPVILINDAPATQEQLQFIKASDVINIEYTRNVSPMYREQGDFLLNIRLKQRKNGGNIIIRAESDILGTRPFASAGFSYNQGKSEWDASYYYNLRNYHKVYDTIIDRFNNSNQAVNINEKDTIPFRYYTHEGALKYTFIPNSKFKVQTRMRYYFLGSQKSGSGTVESSIYGNYSINQYYYTRTSDPNLDIYMRYDINPKNFLEMNITGRLNKTEYKSNVTNKGAGINKEIYSSINSRRYVLLTQIQYTHNFTDKSVLSTSFSNSCSFTSNEYQNIGSRGDIHDNFNYIGAQYQYGINAVWLSIQSGINLNQRIINDCKELSIANKTWASMSWNMVSNWTSELNFMLAPIIPQSGQLIAPTQEISPYLYSAANPELKNGLDYGVNLKINYNKNIWHASISGDIEFLKNPIESVISYNAQNNRYLLREENINQALGFKSCLEFGMNGLLNKYFIYCNFYTSYGKAKINDWIISKWGFGGNLNIGAKFGKWIIHGVLNLPDYRLYGLTRFLAGERYNSLGVQFKPNDHWTLNLHFDYFNKSGSIYKNESYSPEYYNYSYRAIKDNAHNLVLSVQYNISIGRVFKSGKERTIHNSDSSTGISTYERF